MQTILALAMLAASVCTAGDEYHPRLCPNNLPKITEIEIENQGVALWANTGNEPPCNAFHVSEADMRRFFRRAGQADPHEIHMTLPESACAARGRAKFADGTEGHWQVDRFATGWLDRPGHARMSMYCRACQKQPWLQ